MASGSFVPLQQRSSWPFWRLSWLPPLHSLWTWTLTGRGRKSKAARLEVNRLTHPGGSDSVLALTDDFTQRRKFCKEPTFPFLPFASLREIPPRSQTPFGNAVVCAIRCPRRGRREMKFREEQGTFPNQIWERGNGTRGHTRPYHQISPATLFRPLQVTSSVLCAKLSYAFRSVKTSRMISSIGTSSTVKSSTCSFAIRSWLAATILARGILSFTSFSLRSSTSP